MLREEGRSEGIRARRVWQGVGVERDGIRGLRSRKRNGVLIIIARGKAESREEVWVVTVRVSGV